jgi:hypothetical protein
MLESRKLRLRTRALRGAGRRSRPCEFRLEREHLLGDGPLFAAAILKIESEHRGHGLAELLFIYPRGAPIDKEQDGAPTRRVTGAGLMSSPRHRAALPIPNGQIGTIVQQDFESSKSRVRIVRIRWPPKGGLRRPGGAV